MSKNEMRRQDRRITDDSVIDKIILSCKSIRLGFADDGEAYIVPMSFGFTNAQGVRTFYFHSANEGRKIRLIKENGFASFQMDCDDEIYGKDNACTYTTSFKSVMGKGKVTILEAKEDKLFALCEIMRHYTGKSDWTFDEKYFGKMCVFSLEAEEISCKVHE